MKLFFIDKEDVLLLLVRYLQLSLVRSSYENNTLKRNLGAAESLKSTLRNIVNDFEDEDDLYLKMISSFDIRQRLRWQRVGKNENDK